jgi:hypothetical protein
MLQMLLYTMLSPHIVRLFDDLEAAERMLRLGAEGDWLAFDEAERYLKRASDKIFLLLHLMPAKALDSAIGWYLDLAADWYELIGGAELEAERSEALGAELEEVGA